MPECAPAVDVNCLRSVACKPISEAKRNYRLYRVVIDGNECTPVDVSPNVVYDVHKVSVQETLW